MHERGEQIRFSGSDLVHFLECTHLTTLDLRDRETPLRRTPEDPEAELIQAKGREHEAAWRARLEARGVRVVDLSLAEGAEARAERTAAAMREGAEVIYHGLLRSDAFVAEPDFLRRVARPSALGSYGYEVVDAKLARSPKAKFIIQLCLYSELLGELQGVLPRMMHLALGDGSEANLRLAEFFRYYQTVKARFLAHVRERPETYPEPCEHCAFCAWRALCEERWRADDHLNQVANITRAQIRKLEAAGVHTLAGLARLSDERVPGGMAAETLEKLKRQAALQLAARESGRSHYEILPTACEPGRGFSRLPPPDEGDLFFDLEGDPYEPGGLEYLFGVYWMEADAPRYRGFWAHDRTQERAAFEAFLDFVAERLARHPGLHVYHYASYEETALKRLMSLHGTREAQVDGLLRGGRLVDLYKVVREAVRVSEPSYSLKNLEAFYMDEREGEVTEAGQSIVWYERWRSTGEAALLDQIRAYNETDCRSTYLLREWLLGLRPADRGWPSEEGAGVPERPSERVAEIEARLAEYEDRLLGGLPGDPAARTAGDRLRELVYFLLDFHRREAKPGWWAMYARQEMSVGELVEDPECIGGLELDPGTPPVPEKQSLVYTYRYPEQEFKLKEGDRVRRADTAQICGAIHAVDEIACTLRLKVAASKGAPPAHLSITPQGPYNTDVLREALYRFADEVVARGDRYRAVRSVLEKAAPRIGGRRPGAPIVRNGSDTIPETIEAVAALDESHLFVQGPPGAGKTYTGSRVIVELLRRGFRVGVSSNSHKAINHLLEAVEARAAEGKFQFAGVKKSTRPEDGYRGRCIEDVSDNDAVLGADYQLVAGTAWLFARPELEATLDYLIVDEAGQVSLANLVAMGTSARNIVLLGDQMQLGQPIQGVHPGRSGESALDYLLDGAATIAPDRGIFLGATWRMHEDVCRFVSEAVYDGRLEPEPGNQRQRLLLAHDAHPELLPTGIRFVPVAHDACSQRSEAEAEQVAALYRSLLDQRWTDRRGRARSLTREDVLVVAPYNLQVNLLRRVLPAGARVGTVDKFQGQEAPVVIVSLATSSADYLPRNIEFLYDKNRLNVAVSRARCLSLIVASPALTAIRCGTVEQMRLVNTLCWVREYAERFRTDAVPAAV